MARKRMVTRTIVGTEVEVKVANATTEQFETKVIVLGGNIKEDKLKKACEKELNNDEITVVKVLSVNEINKCYGMDESLFLSLAQELDPETRKGLEA